MDKYNLNDFWRYFGDSYILDNEGEVQYVSSPSENENGIVVRRKIANKNVDKVILLQNLDWKRNAPIVRCGYRDLDNSGKSLYYIVRRVERVTNKGISNNTIRINREQYVADAMVRLGLNANKYIEDARLSQKLAEVVYKPVFKPFREAINDLQKKGDAVGYALSHDLAMVLGHGKDTSLLILLQHIPAAYSADGINWKVYANEHRDIINRQLGKVI